MFGNSGLVTATPWLSRSLCPFGKDSCPGWKGLLWGRRTHGPRNLCRRCPPSLRLRPVEREATIVQARTSPAGEGRSEEPEGCASPGKPGVVPQTPGRCASTPRDGGSIKPASCSFLLHRAQSSPGLFQKALSVQVESRGPRLPGTLGLEGSPGVIR